MTRLALVLLVSILAASGVVAPPAFAKGAGATRAGFDAYEWSQCGYDVATEEHTALDPDGDGVDALNRPRSGAGKGMSAPVTAGQSGSGAGGMGRVAGSTGGLEPLVRRGVDRFGGDPRLRLVDHRDDVPPARASAAVARPTDCRSCNCVDGRCRTNFG